MIYLKVNQDSQNFSSFSVITNDNLTVNDMGKSKKKIIPMRPYLISTKFSTLEY